MDQDLITLSKKIGGVLTNHHLSLATAESCTGGLLSHVLTGVSGSSQYFMGGIVAYSNHIKTAILSVQSDTMDKYGAVSSQTAAEMAEGIRKLFHTDIGLSTTGIAGPTGGTPEKPVGLVWTGISTPQSTQTRKNFFEGHRNQVKTSTVHQILLNLLDDLSTQLDNTENKNGK